MPKTKGSTPEHATFTRTGITVTRHDHDAKYPWWFGFGHAHGAAGYPTFDALVEKTLPWVASRRESLRREIAELAEVERFLLKHPDRSPV